MENVLRGKDCLVGDQLIEAEATEVNQTFFDALAADHQLGSTRGIDFVLKKFKLYALVLPANGKGLSEIIRAPKSRDLLL